MTELIQLEFIALWRSTITFALRALLWSPRLANLAQMIPHSPLRRQLGLLTVLWAMTLLTREPDAFDLRLGQRAYVDDGTCPQGQVKEVTGAKLTSSGVERTRKCVPRNSVR
jgi:hypothetical protein